MQLVPDMEPVEPVKRIFLPDRVSELLLIASTISLISEYKMSINYIIFTFGKGTMKWPPDSRYSLFFLIIESEKFHANKSK